VKIGTKGRKKQKQSSTITAIILFFLESNKTHLAHDTGGRKMRESGEASSRRRLTGFGGGAPDAEAIFTAFFTKIRMFISIFWSKFLLKTRF